jgi:hypothetical protein
MRYLLLILISSRAAAAAAELQQVQDSDNIHGLQNLILIFRI